MGRTAYDGVGRLGVGALVALVVVLEALGASAGEVLQVTHSDARALRVEAAGLTAQWVTEPGAPDGDRAELRMPGLLTGGLIGGWRVPRDARWIVVPPGTRPEVVTLSEEWQAGGGRRLTLSSIPATRRGRSVDEQGFLDLHLEPGQVLPEGMLVTPDVLASRAQGLAPRTGRAVEVGEVTTWRGRHVAPLRFVPVRHGADGVVQGVLAAGTWEIRFVEDRAAKGVPQRRPRRDTRNDEQLSAGFLNGHLLESLPTEAAFHGVTPPAGAIKSAEIADVTLASAEVRIGVATTNLFRVGADRLRQQGLLTDDAVDESWVRLYQRRYDPDLDTGDQPPYREVEVPLHMVGEGDDFAGDDFLVFYGLRSRDDVEFITGAGAEADTIPSCGDNGEWNNDYNVYWLMVAEPPVGSSWARMETATVASASLPAERNYRRADYQEDQEIFRLNMPTRTADRTYYNHHLDPSVSVGLSPRWSPDPAGAPARLEVGAAAYVDSNLAVVRLIDVDLVRDNTFTRRLGTLRVGSIHDRTFAIDDIPASELVGQTARLEFLPRVASIWAYVNWARMTYDAFYQAVGNRLDFHTGDAAGPRALEVTGFDDGGIGLFEVTDPRAPRFIQLGAGNVVDTGTSFTLSIQPDQPAADEPRRYWAVGNWQGTGIGEFNHYDASVADDPVDPTAVAAAPDLLVITHEEFQGPVLDRWLAHRVARSGGELDYHVVEIQDLFDWYSGGMRDAWSVRRLVNHALVEWGTWAMVIVGDANENARELAVRPEARGWSRDWVPTHYHLQAAETGISELLAADKWFVCSETGETDATDNFPYAVRSPWSMVVGRLPVNSVNELERIVDKTIVMETPGEGEDWRRRAIIIGDDTWSSGYGAEALQVLAYNATDIPFEVSQGGYVASTWAEGGPVALETNPVMISTWLDPLYPDIPHQTGSSRPINQVREDTEAVATPRLLAALNQGGLVAHYQGHANLRVISTEYWLKDLAIHNRQDLNQLNNTGRPFLFFGMGCHIGDLAQSPAQSPGSVHERSFCEKLLTNSRAGAVGSYGSSGFEYIHTNVQLSEMQIRFWTERPPTARRAGATEGRSRWMWGELMWNTEAIWLANYGGNSTSRQAASQFIVMGDPLMMLDAGPPQVTAILQGEGEISGEVDVVASDASNLRIIEIAALDEAGIDRLLVTDSSGADLTSTVVVMADSLPAGEADHQEVHYRLAVPVRPFAHTVGVEVWDTGAPLASDRHWTLTLAVGQEVAFTSGGEPVDPGVFEFEPDLPVNFNAEVTSGAWLHDGMTMELRSADLDLDNVVFDLGKSNTMALAFTATAAAGSEGERSVDLVIDEHTTTWVLQAGDQALPDAVIGQVYNYPNPMVGDTRIVFETGAASCRGVVRIFSAAGRTIARLPVQHDGSGSGVVPWDGRDAQGDEVANGTYLYRVELFAPGKAIASEVQRLVVMR